jgi:hypothetical protein
MGKVGENLKKSFEPVQVASQLDEPLDPQLQVVEELLPTYHRGQTFCRTRLRDAWRQN